MAAVGHQVEGKLASSTSDSYWAPLKGSDPEQLWNSATHLRSADLAYGDVVRRLASKRVRDGSLASSSGRELNPTWSAEVTDLNKELAPLVAKGSGDSELVPALVAVAPERVAEVARQLGGNPEPLLALKPR